MSGNYSSQLQSNSSLSTSQSYTKEIQRIKEHVLYLTEFVKGDRNILNKHFQNSITNYFMEDYASQFLKEKMGLKTFKEVKHAIDAKLIQKKQQEQGTTKYMNLINIYREEHISQGTFTNYQQHLKAIAFSDEDLSLNKGSSDWTTIAWKKATSLFVYHHSNNTHLTSIFDIWNDLFPEDPIVKKKKTKEDKLKQETNPADSLKSSEETPTSGPALSKRQIQKNKIPLYNCKKLRRILAEQKQAKQQALEESSGMQEHHPKLDIDTSNSISQAKAILATDGRKKKGKGKKTERQEEIVAEVKEMGQQLNESVPELKDSIYHYTQYIKNQVKNSYELFPDFQLVQLSGPSEASQAFLAAISGERPKENCDIEVTNTIKEVFNSVVLVNNQEHQQQTKKNNEKAPVESNMKSLSFGDEDFFTRNMNIFSDIGIAELKGMAMPQKNRAPSDLNFVPDIKQSQQILLANSGIQDSSFDNLRSDLSESFQIDKSNLQLFNKLIASTANPLLLSNPLQIDRNLFDSRKIQGSIFQGLSNLIDSTVIKSPPKQEKRGIFSINLGKGAHLDEQQLAISVEDLDAKINALSKHKIKGGKQQEPLPPSHEINEGQKNNFFSNTSFPITSMNLSLFQPTELNFFSSIMPDANQK